MKLNFTLSRIQLLFMGILLNSFVFSQTVYTFTSCGVSGSTGPTQAQANSSYATTNLSGNVTVTGGIQYWTVPTTGNYSIEAFGGQGYGAFGGRGAHIYGEFTLNAGDQLKILVGQKAGDYTNYPATTYDKQYGGGGGSFVTSISDLPFVVAGGGGGSHAAAFSTSCDGQITLNGAPGTNASTSGTGGINGMGGSDASLAHGGGGFYGNGLTTAGGGKAFVNGGLGGFQYGYGGFGGGGGTTSWNNYRGGGGGGYSGGGASNNGATCCASGGGGGSFNAGINQNNIAGVQLGNGIVKITLTQSFPNDAGISELPNLPACIGTFPLLAKVQNYGNNILNSVVVNWSINGVVQTPYNITTPLDTTGGMGSTFSTVTLGNLTILGNTTVKVWSSNPNMLADAAPGNDTVLVEIEPLIVTANYLHQINCFGGTNGVAQASCINNNATPSYSWSSGSTNQYMIGVGAGTYLLTASDGTCTDTASIIFVQPTAINSSGIITNISCNGSNDGEVALSISGGTPGYNVSWTGGLTGSTIDSLDGGVYHYTITDAHGCTSTDSAIVNEPSVLSINGTISPETFGSDGIVLLNITGGSSPYNFSWSNGSTNQNLTTVAAGTYNVQVTDNNGCIANSSFVVNSVVGIGDLQQNPTILSLYPNPSNGNFTLEIDEKLMGASIDIVDVLGNTIESFKVNTFKTQMSIHPKDGVYLLKISKDNFNYVKRILIQD